MQGSPTLEIFAPSVGMATTAISTANPDSVFTTFLTIHSHAKSCKINNLHNEMRLAETRLCSGNKPETSFTVLTGFQVWPKASMRMLSQQALGQQRTSFFAGQRHRYCQLCTACTNYVYQKSIQFPWFSKATVICILTLK